MKVLRFRKMRTREEGEETISPEALNMVLDELKVHFSHTFIGLSAVCRNHDHQLCEEVTGSLKRRDLMREDGSIPRFVREAVLFSVGENFCQEKAFSSAL